MKKIKNFIAEFTDDHNRFGFTAMMLIVTAILGGIAAGLFMNSFVAMGIIVGLTMLTEAFILAIQPMKRIFNTALMACAVNISFIIAGLM